MIRTLILVGVITVYLHPYVGGPLRCGSVNGASPIYDTMHAWIAIDIDRYDSFRCGDLVQVDANGVQLLLWVKDSGPLARHCIYIGDTCIEIVGDLPAHVWPGGDALSIQGSIRNVTGELRERMEVEQ